MDDHVGEMRNQPDTKAAESSDCVCQWAAPVTGLADQHRKVCIKLDTVTQIIRKQEPWVNGDPKHSFLIL